MPYLSDIEIAHSCKMKPITEIAEKVGIPEDYLEAYGRYKAKIDTAFLKNESRKTENSYSLRLSILPLRAKVKLPLP